MKVVFNPFTGKFDYVVTKATEVAITDSGSYYTGTEVETALQEIGADLATFITTETDPIYTASSWFSTTNNSANWDTAFGWGDHGAAGYLTSASAASTYVPYTGATTDVTLGSHYLRADSGFGMGSAPTSVNYNYILKTTASVLASPTTLNITHTVTAATTGVATGMLILATQQSATATPAGMAGMYGFWTGTSGSTSGTVSGINFTARDSRTGSYTGTTLAGGTLTGQLGSTCNSAFSNAVYGGIYTLLDLSAGGAVPTAPSAAAIVSTITFGNLSVSNAWRYFWALAGSGTTSAPVYGFEIGRVNNSSGTNAALQLDGTNEVNNMIRWGTTNAPWIYRSANNTLTLDSSSGTASLIVLGTVTGTQLISNIATGTAPLTVASTTKVTNLNADLLDDQTGSYYLDSGNFTGTNWTDLTDSGDTTLHTHDGRYYTESEVDTLLGGYITKAAGYEDITATLTATAGEKISKQIPYGCTIVSWTITSADTSYTSGSASVKVNKCTYANYPTFSLISASDPLVITTSTKGTGSALTGWTTAITAGDFIEFEVDSATTITKVVVTLKVQRT